MYVIRNLSNLEHLDDIKITDDLRALANADDCNTNHVNIYFRKTYPSVPNIQTIWKYDTKTNRSISKHGISYENLDSLTNHYYN